MKGEPYGRLFTVTPAVPDAGGSESDDPAGARQHDRSSRRRPGRTTCPPLNLINIRVQKEFVIKDTQRLQLMFNMFNFADAKTVTAVYQLTGQSFG